MLNLLSILSDKNKTPVVRRPGSVLHVRRAEARSLSPTTVPVVGNDSWERCGPVLAVCEPESQPPFRSTISNPDNLQGRKDFCSTTLRVVSHDAERRATFGTRALFGTSRSASSTDRFATTDSRPRLLRKSNVSRPQPRGRGSRLESVGARGSLHGRIAHVVLPGRAEWSERRFPMATTTVGHAEVAIGHDRLPASEN